MLTFIHQQFLKTTNLNSSIICCLSSGDIYLFFISSYFHIFFCFIISMQFFGRFFRSTCYFISNFITNQITSCFWCFLNCSFRCCFFASVVYFLALSRSFWLYLLLKLLVTLFACIPMFLAKDKNPYPYPYLFNWISHFYTRESHILFN